MIFDCDARESVELEAAACVGAGPVPTPNYASARTASGHFQIGYFLGRPVHRGTDARLKPLAYLGRVAEFYRGALQADPGYVGVLAYNPVNPDYTTSYPREHGTPYSLQELAAVIPRGWRIPKVPTTDVGRNCALYRALCKLALGGSDEGLLTWARTLNREFSVPLADAEVRGVWRSVCRSRARWRVQGGISRAGSGNRPHVGVRAARRPVWRGEPGPR